MLLSLLTLTFAFITASATPPTPPNYQISTPTVQLQNEEQVWYCPTDSNIIIANWRDFRLGFRQIGVGRSEDAGNSWTDELVNYYLQVYDRQSDPTLTVDVEGNFYNCFLDYSSYDANVSSITFLKSTDKGASWLGPYSVLAPTGVNFEDKQFIAADRTSSIYQGNVYVAWARFPNPVQIMFSRSIGGSMTFETPIVVGPPYSYNNKCGSGSNYDAGQFAFPFVGSDGSVYVAWAGSSVDTTDCQFYTTLKLVKSTDGGASFSAMNDIVHTFGNWGQVDGAVDVYNAPIVAADIFGGPFDGNIYIAYADADTSNHIYYDYNIQFVRSVDGGESWSEPFFINDDMTGSTAMYDQFHPWLIVNEEGILITIFYDQRTDPISHYKFDVFASYSYDGGLTFTTNHRISDVSINPDWLISTAANSGAGEKTPVSKVQMQSMMAGKIAEYIGVAAYHDRITGVWTDTRNGNQDVFGANWHLPLLEPRLLSPASNDTIEISNPELRWATSWKNNDDRYRVELSRDPLFGTILYTNLIDTNFAVVSGLNLVWGDYYWRVKSFKISTGDSTEYSSGQFFAKIFKCGDANSDGKVNLLDVSFIIRFKYQGGTAPVPPEAADVDHSGTINLLDVSYLINYLYRHGPAPDCP
jgi:hypothetical protein